MSRVFPFASELGPYQKQDKKPRGKVFDRLCQVHLDIVNLAIDDLEAAYIPIPEHVKKTSAYIDRTRGESCSQPCCEYFPYYGLIPHQINEGYGVARVRFLPESEWPNWFVRDEINPRFGTYYCPSCFSERQDGSADNQG